MSNKSTLQATPAPQAESDLPWDSGNLVTVRRQTSFDTVVSKLSCLAHLVKNSAGGQYDRLQPPETEAGHDVAWGFVYILQDIGTTSRT